MTVSECTKEWLGGVEGLEVSEFSTDFIEADMGSYGIFKSPNKTIVPFNDGSKLVTEYYQFFGRKATNADTERISNQQVLADLEDWIEEKNFSEDYPDLSGVGKLTCTEISVANSATITDQTDNNAIYQITIAIQYHKEI